MAGEAFAGQVLAVRRSIAANNTDLTGQTFLFNSLQQGLFGVTGDDPTNLSGTDLGLDIDGLARYLVTFSGDAPDVDGYSSCEMYFAIDQDQRFVVDFTGTLGGRGGRPTNCRYRALGNGVFEVASTSITSRGYNGFGEEATSDAQRPHLAASTKRRSRLARWAAARS